MGVKKEVVVSISYFNFKFESLSAANMFASLASSTIDDKGRGVEMVVKYIPVEDTDDVEEDKEEEG